MLEDVGRFVTECRKIGDDVEVTVGGDFNAQPPSDVPGITGRHLHKPHWVDSRANEVVDFLRRYGLRVQKSWRPPDGRSQLKWTWIRNWTGVSKWTRRQYDYI